ncbi:hypothetical protein [Allorhizocola rhizosphaerae]|uniref:hypothetical protein n=1 Tax=Allorhizocola rhizosphaerae TaxID=1872709 RepID=UPI000E3E1C95|nr:hypothetical protein [Allorhizocola rhizosphaerae]
MKTRLFAGGIGVLAAATFALAGCGDNPQPSGTDSTPPPTSSAPQASAKEAFTNAVKKLQQQSSKAELKMDGMVAMTATTQTDPAGKKATSATEVNVSGVKVTTSILANNGEVWVKMTGVPGAPDKWMHVAADKVAKGSSLDLTKDQSTRLEASIVTVERDGASGFKGTLDLTKMGTVSEDLVKQLGDKAKALPFTATVDSQGRLSTMEIDLNGAMAGLGKMTTKYSAYGEPVNVTPPAASEVVEMPEQFLAALNKPV